MVTQIGVYFFLASGVPFFGSSSSAMAALATTQAATAAAAKTKSLLPLLLSSLSALNSRLAFSASVALRALAMTRPLVEALAEGSLPTTADEPARKEAVMVMEAISAASVG